jgi:biopolymer transport protein ExbD
MVDLGFLLITFFMFATVLTAPTALKLVMPKVDSLEPINPNKMPEEAGLNILIKDSKTLLVYDGNNLESQRQITPAQVRQQVQAKQKQVFDEFGGQQGVDKNMMVLIKPLANSTYTDVINVLDEMKINEVKLYAIVQPKDIEAQMAGL